MAFTPPEHIAEWTRHRQLGNGAFGDAWIYERNRTRVEYAVFKFLLRSGPSIELTRARFIREREILSGLNNPKVSRLIADDLQHNPPWIATEVFSGRSLESVLENKKQIDGKEWARLASDVLEGLDYVHKQGIVHRDLNPGNIVDAEHGYKIIDFGIASSENVLIRYSGNHRIHHWHYASPEQILEQDTDEKTDVFTLGTLLVYAATGKSPWTNDPRVFTKERTESLTEDIHRAIVDPSFKPLYRDMSSNQKLLLQAMHQRDPKKRPSASEALRELKRLSTQEFVQYLSSGTSRKPVKAAPAVAKKKPATVRSHRVGPKLAISGNSVQVVEGSASVDPVKLNIGKDRVWVSPENPPANRAKSKSPHESFWKKYWKEILIAWIFTPFGWMAYRFFKDKKKKESDPTKITNLSLNSLKKSFLIVHGLSFGFFAPIVGLLIFKRRVNRKVTIFVALNSFTIIFLFAAISQTPSDETLATFPSVVLFLNYVSGFFLPLLMRSKKSSQDLNSTPEFSDKIDPFDDEEYLANAQAKLKAVPTERTWDDLLQLVKRILIDSSIEQFNIEFEHKLISGIYFQGYRDNSGCITVEAAANLSVRPEITQEQNRNIIRVGWEPPAGDNPNYVKFLDLTQSNIEFISNLVITTLQTGYGVAVESLEPVFSVSVGNEVIYVDFDEFKRLTS